MNLFLPFATCSGLRASLLQDECSPAKVLEWQNLTETAKEVSQKLCCLLVTGMTNHNFPKQKPEANSLPKHLNKTCSVSNEWCENKEGMGRERQSRQVVSLG